MIRISSLRESFKSAVRDQVHAVLVVRFAADVPADVVQQGGVFNQLALRRPQAVQRSRVVKQLHTQARNVFAVMFMPGTTPRQRDHAAQARLRHLLSNGQVRQMTRQVVDKQPLAQRRFADMNATQSSVGRNSSSIKIAPATI